MKHTRWSVGLAMAAVTGLAGGAGAAETFGSDVAFLKKHVEVIELGSGGGKVAVVPAYQGRVMTSTTGGEAGPSFGWMNRPVIEKGLLSPAERAGKLESHIYVFGGEERFWLGPEGGQNAIFFAPGAPFDFDHWSTPSVIDTEPFAVVEKSAEVVKFSKAFVVTNWSGTVLTGGIERDVRVLGRAAVEQAFGIALADGVQAVAYETDNRLTNRGTAPWTREKGLLSIWLLGMYTPSPGTTVVIPFKAGAESELGPKVNDAYFGKVPAEYLSVKDDVLFFKGDGTRRGKIGISPARSKGIAGSYAAEQNVLTLVTYTSPEGPAPYVNSMWEMQKNPYGGDVLNSYNDGSPAPGKPPLGPFYELETSSPGAELAPGATLRHVQRTLHLSGPKDVLDRIARAKFGVGLDAIAGAFKP